MMTNENEFYFTFPPASHHALTTTKSTRLLFDFISANYLLSVRIAGYKYGSRFGEAQFKFVSKKSPIA
jgi:hypothetical protein